MALRAFVRSVAQPWMALQCDSEPAIIDVVKRICDATPGLQMRTTPAVSKGSNGRVEQKNKAVEGMATLHGDTSASCLPAIPPLPGHCATQAGYSTDSSQAATDKNFITGITAGTTRTPCYPSQRRCYGGSPGHTC